MNLICYYVIIQFLNHSCCSHTQWHDVPSSSWDVSYCCGLKWPLPGCPMLPNETIQYPIVWPFGSQTLHKTSREHGHSTCHSKAWNRFGLAWGTVSMFLMIGELCMSWGKSQCRRSPAKKLERHCLAPKLGGKIATDCNWQLGSWLRKSREFEDLHNTSRSFHNPNRLRNNEKCVISRIMAIISNQWLDIESTCKGLQSMSSGKRDGAWSRELRK